MEAGLNLPRFGLNGSLLWLKRFASVTANRSAMDATESSFKVTLLIRTLKLPLPEVERRFAVDSHELS